MYFPAAYGEHRDRADMLATVHSGASGYAQKAAAAHGEPLQESVYPELLQPWEQPISKGKTVGSKE